MQQPTRPSTQSKAWSEEKYVLALEVNKSETSSPNLATGYNRFTQCKPWPILLIIVSSNFVLKLKDRIGQTIKQGCFYDGLTREKKTPRQFMNIRERPLTVHEDKGLKLWFLLVETKQEAINVNIYGRPGKTWASMKPYMEEITKFCSTLINVNCFVPKKQKTIISTRKHSIT